MLFMAVPVYANVLNIRQYNDLITQAHGVSYPVLWNNGKVLSVYLYRYTLGETTLRRELDANVCGGYMSCEQMRAVGIAKECKNFGTMCRGR